jgi:hypothetical protein
MTPQPGKPYTYRDDENPSGEYRVWADEWAKRSGDTVTVVRPITRNDGVVIYLVRFEDGAECTVYAHELSS